ncbi:uncharacterized protein C8Q71DRAFT_399834 [Rhodofomes roseus]|uniref:F-box domain-containing protein n=1 Tax=Rhodofomes roseus TaxID=34475 RepID=A0ABQ8K0C9_9APHY|nr:uncharacterized protein C8Q71DRAFT_399834 [Rhodofomes roseus]KAH9829531.1 hypothetical protein C8Q71DRAFT_399834 [Rhodofomes roseus]
MQHIAAHNEGPAAFGIDPGSQIRGTSVPGELCDRIIDAVGYGVREWDFVTCRDSLRACSLVCKAWLPRSRMHLWTTVTLCGRNELQALSRVLTKYSHWGNNVFELNIDIDDAGWQTFPLLLAHKLPRMVQLRLQGRREHNGNLLLRPLHFSALSTFTSCLHWTEWRHCAVPSAPLYKATSVTRFQISDVALPSLSALGYVLISLPSLTTLICEFVSWDNDGSSLPFTPSTTGLLHIHDLSIRDMDFSEELLDGLLTIIDPKALDTLRVFPRSMDQIQNVGRLCDRAGPSLRHLFIGDTSKMSVGASNYPNPFPGLCNNINIKTLRFEAYGRDLRWLSLAVEHFQLPFLTRLIVMSNCPFKLRKLHLSQLDRCVSRIGFNPGEVVFEIYSYQLERLTRMLPEISRMMVKTCSRGALRFQPGPECEWWERL